MNEDTHAWAKERLHLARQTVPFLTPKPPPRCLAAALAAPERAAAVFLADRLTPRRTMSPPPPANAPPPPLGSSAPLPEGWAEAFTEDGGRYYWNASTGATSWEMPTSTGVVTKPAAFPQQRGLDNIGSPIAAVKAMNASSSKKAEGLAPRLTSLQAANGDLAEARATAQQKVEELKAAADQASTAAMGAVRVEAALASRARRVRAAHRGAKADAQSRNGTERQKNERGRKQTLALE